MPAFRHTHSSSSPVAARVARLYALGDALSFHYRNATVGAVTEEAVRALLRAEGLSETQCVAWWAANLTEQTQFLQAAYAGVPLQHIYTRRECSLHRRLGTLCNRCVILDE